MGGSGSGRTGGRPTYESTGSLILSMSSFTRGGLARGLHGTATVTYHSNGDPLPVAITLDTRDRHFPFIELAHERRTGGAEREQYRIGLETSPQPFGGERWWFCCPATRRRAIRLFLPRGGHQFWSRHAYRLGYASQREDRMGRAQRQAEKVYASLGGKGNWMDGPPLKPKWMRWETYERKAARLDHLDAIYDAAWGEGACRLLARWRRLDR